MRSKDNRNSPKSFGKPLEKLIRAGMVEFRIFLEQRGRGGNIVKVRIDNEKDQVKRLVDRLASTEPPAKLTEMISMPIW